MTSAQAAKLPYQELPSALQFSSQVTDKVDVIEFFSYTCPWCYRLDPILMKWVKKNQSRLHFHRVPVEFNTEWARLAKAYYVASALQLEDKVSPALFEAQQRYGHSKAMPLTEIAKVFATHGIDNKTFEQAMSASPTVRAQLGEGRKLAKQLNIYQIPSLVIAGRWQTDPQLAGGLLPLLKVLDQLVQKTTQQS